MLELAVQHGNHPAIREKDLGIWQTWTWAEVAQEVRLLACGLLARGFRRGDRLGVIGDNRPRLYWSMLAAQCLGGIPVPLYQDAVADEMVYVLQDADIHIAVVEDQEQVDKLLEIRDRCPGLQAIVYDNPRGMRHYTDAMLLDYVGLRAEGELSYQVQPEQFSREVAQGQSSDIAIMLYTSGTTGQPKGVCHTHLACITMAQVDAEFDGLDRHDAAVAYLPMAWVGDHLFSYAQALVTGFTVHCPESSDTVMSDMREVGPTYFFAPPRIYESILTQVSIRMEDASWIKRRVFRFFMDQAKLIGPQMLDGHRVSFGQRLTYWLGNLLVFAPLKNVLGLSRVKVAYTGGEAIGPDLFDFYRSLGINLKQLYGMTETFVSVCMHPNGGVKLGTVGKPMKGVEIKLDESGEIMVKSPGLLKEYFKRPDATAEAFTQDGFFHTGDAGYFDDEGHLRIIDRAKDVGKMNDGTLFAPKFIENKLKFFPYIKEAVVFGDKRDEATAFINIDMQAVGNWAERHGLPYSGYTDLAGQVAVYELIRECVKKVNKDLSHDSKLGGSQIKRFLVLHKELDADDGELTRTRKVRRRYIAEKYQVLIDALYEGLAHCEVDAQVRFEDGRTGHIRADLKIWEVRTFPVVDMRKEAA
ncbi:AMP-binding protein [Chitinivorax sp. B]|uniref:AMP-dependent synthetase/ligase n=1 Tax=Chitinivorax sp. B TaxID=2502235 RepID=UPI00201800F1|nr:AMP-binding protein [Chitinivorax sp. B]